MLYFRSILIVLQKRPFSERRDRSLENLVTPSLNSRFFGADCQSRRGGRGEEWSGDACVAHGGRWEAAGEQDAGRPKGPHPSSLPPPPLRDEAVRTGRSRFLVRFTKFLSLRASRNGVLLSV